jgi:hypothetical protein
MHILVRIFASADATPANTPPSLPAGFVSQSTTIGRIRVLARQVAEAWLAERSALGFPLLHRRAAPRFFASLEARTRTVRGNPE